MTSHTAPTRVRFTGTRTATAYWLREPGTGELRVEDLPEPGPGEVLVRSLHSGISRGTELLVHRGGVPAEEREAMRAPFQAGTFPGPVKYGYLSVGRVEAGPAALRGRTVFCLHPHQTAYVVPADAVVVVPDGVPARRAVLAGTVETALNAVWDLGPLPGDRVAVVGAGMVGCSVARLLARIPEVEVTLVDVDPHRADVARQLGVGFADPPMAPTGLDAVVHTSATAAGLQRSLDLLAPEGTVLDLSWYGDQRVHLALGASFHSRRLTVRASQVGAVAAARRHRHSHADRLAIALRLLRDPAYDALLTGDSPFEDLPEVMAALAAGRLAGLCHTVTYAEGDPCTP
ncbi:dehydrogenase [Nocardioides sp. MAH-18]|uniref:Dehydrogenase n=1 Tax=Nocardioides agri TaxID=2682843 RepID=A0A6L6XNP6_9ACTN|nr:zinc-binding alcohol dehydrogenase [Nocardioides sp. CGMCC 1.13656]MBA2953694.1 zinc-binding alcohol dehydrogenase [Nocardioides sp. CGMCC 1.13656]MVQ48558.1 dehydrogenase [Nocardioides sp. MAH-18]